MKMTLRGVVGFALVTLLIQCGYIAALQAAGPTNLATNSALESLQGKWRGEMVGDKSSGNITVTISSNSFHFYRDTNFWFDTTIALPPATEPRQLHATIKNTAESQADSIGKIVVAIYKIEDGTLTLAVGNDGEAPKTFSDPSNRYVFKQVRPEKEPVRPNSGPAE